MHVVEVDGVGRNAYSTSIEFSLTLDDLAHAVALAATTLAPVNRRFRGSLAHNAVADESYWSEADTADAVAIAASIGPGSVYAAARSELRAHGERWRFQAWEDVFPPEAARQRAAELFPMLGDAGNPFAPAPDVTDR